MHILENKMNSQKNKISPDNKIIALIIALVIVLTAISFVTSENVSALNLGSSVKLNLTIDPDAPYVNETNPIDAHKDTNKDSDETTDTDTDSDSATTDENTNSGDSENIDQTVDSTFNIENQNSTQMGNRTKQSSSSEDYNKAGFILLFISPILLIGFLIIILAYSRKNKSQEQEDF